MKSESQIRKRLEELQDKRLGRKSGLERERLGLEIGALKWVLDDE